MLCGAADTEDIRGQFAKVVEDFGGQPMHYKAGTILYLNSADSSWPQNSQMTVRAADLCVFVIVEKYGDITWNTELREARAEGKPFLVLCLDRTYKKYDVLRKSLIDPGSIRTEDDRKLLATIQQVAIDWQSTIITFTYQSFESILRSQLSILFHVVLQRQQMHNRRAMIARLVADDARLSEEERTVAITIAVDELEEKNVRKRALLALTKSGGVSNDIILDLVSSEEQGVQRLAVQHLGQFYRQRPVESEFLLQCVQVANGADDVGVARRLIPVLLELDLTVGLAALAHLDTTEIGTRRRIAETLERHEQVVIDLGLRADALDLLSRCLEDTAEIGWKARCRQLRARLSGDQE